MGFVITGLIMLIISIWIFYWDMTRDTSRIRDWDGSWGYIGLMLILASILVMTAPLTYPN